MHRLNFHGLSACVLSALLAGCAGASGGSLAQPTGTAAAVEPSPAAITTVAQAHPVATTSASAATEPATDKKDKKDRKTKKRKDKLNGLFSNKPIQTGTMQPDGTYKLSDAELEMSCKKLTGRAYVRILQIRDHSLSQTSTPVARGMQQVVSPVFGGSTYGIDPDTQYRRDRAMVEAYNQRLAEKRCKVFDLVKELQPKPAGESPTLMKR